MTFNLNLFYSFLSKRGDNTLTLYFYFKILGLDDLSGAELVPLDSQLDLLTQEPVLSYPSVCVEQLWTRKWLVVIRKKTFSICLWSGKFSKAVTQLTNWREGRKSSKLYCWLLEKKDYSLVVGTLLRPVRYCLRVTPKNTEMKWKPTVSRVVRWDPSATTAAKNLHPGCLSVLRVNVYINKEKYLYVIKKISSNLYI